VQVFAAVDAVMAEAPLPMPVNTVFALPGVVTKLESQRLLLLIEPDKQIVILVVEP
jgi:hypothetical protein